VVGALVLTHITIVPVTVFLHRNQAHRALDLHPVVSHFFRLWLWLTTGMVTKQWAAVHRKHHAKCDTKEDPHSPQILGLNRVLWGGVFLYVKEAKRPDTIERYGRGTPADWIERNLYSKFTRLGLILMGVIDIILFGLVPGVLILATQIAWIPFWAAGVGAGARRRAGSGRWSSSRSACAHTREPGACAAERSAWLAWSRKRRRVPCADLRRNPWHMRRRYRSFSAAGAPAALPISA
jgi:stearoyl-CoA desaturase (delta-9 desaturase)